MAEYDEKLLVVGPLLLATVEYPRLEARAVPGGVQFLLDGQPLPVLAKPGWKLEKVEHGVIFTSSMMVQISEPEKGG